MIRLFLIRHGEPEAPWGEAAADPGLSELGRRQAEGAAAALAELGPAMAIVSPMRRCRETAAPWEIKSGIEALVEPRVSEVATPPEVTDRRAWLQETFPWRGAAHAPAWTSLDPALQQWRRDTIAAVSALEQDAAIFTHFVAINALVGAALDRDDTISCRPDYASITELALDNGALQFVRFGAEMRLGDVG